MLYMIGFGALILILVVALAVRRLTRRRPPLIFPVLGTLPVLAWGAAHGHWSAVAALLVVLIVGIPILLWAEARWPSEAPSNRRPG